jgi:hypothetical protein
LSFCSARYFRLLCLLLRLHASRACAMAMLQLLALLSQAVRNLLAQGLKFQHPSQGLACGDAPGKHKPVGGGNKLRETPVCRCDLPSLLVISILARLLAFAPSHPPMHTQAALLASLWSGGSERRSIEEADDHQKPQAARPDARAAREGAGSGTRRQGGDSSGQKGKPRLATPSLLWIFFLAATILGGSVFVSNALLNYKAPRQVVVED